MRTTDGPPQITAYEIRPGESLTVWRIVQSGHRDDPVFERSFRSHFALDDEPRGLEQQSCLIHMGISAYLAERTAHGTAEKWWKLGDWVARLELRPGHGFNFAHTGHRLHLPIWGDPVKLSEAAVDIAAVRK